jgi:hypothetical protein
VWLRTSGLHFSKEIFCEGAVQSVGFAILFMTSCGRRRPAIAPTLEVTYAMADGDVFFIVRILNRNWRLVLRDYSHHRIREHEFLELIYLRELTIEEEVSCYRFQ